MENMIGQFWNRNRIVLKSFWIGFLILILLIPTFLISGLITERQSREQAAVTEISSRWAGAQTITGPVIGIPYISTVTDNSGGAESQKRWAYFLPGKLDISARIVPEKRYRGIYQVIVYTTVLQVRCHYDSLHLQELDLPAGKMLWSEAAVFFNLSDVQGLQEEISLRLDTRNGGADLDLVPAKFSTDQFKNALSAVLPDWLPAAAAGPLEFSTTVRMKGTGNLSFAPTGRETKVEVSSSWPDPSFSGSNLPDLRTVKDSGFVADWRVLALNRNFPQQWKGNTFDLEPAAFGVSLIVPVDTYQQTTRCVKYAILIILLTFTAFFLIECVYQRPIHSLQYLLVGFALCLFYTLLLSLSEYVGFNSAYAMAAAGTIGLITWYVGSMLRSGKMSSFICFFLAVQYGFVFILIQLQDYALLMGSIGLFITLAAVMYFSRKIKWSAA
ncbi:MAG TPA: cell envelope integrity protein CreD [Puia sp.]|jgi:inner membrane protein|nr:cell envelope integrity protein CreD [Puia sp.]